VPSTRAQFLLLLPLTGCGAYYTASGHAVAAGALDDLTSPAADAKYAEAATITTRAAAVAARTELLGPETNAASAALVKSIGAAAQTEVSGVIRAAGDSARTQLRLVMDEALGAAALKEIAALREQLVGAPLQNDLNTTIDSAAPHLTAAVSQALTKITLPVQAAADAEANKWRPIATAFAVGCGLLFVCLGFAGWLIREHQKTIRSITGRT
jgi:hypothetical protein